MLGERTVSQCAGMAVEPKLQHFVHASPPYAAAIPLCRDLALVACTKLWGQAQRLLAVEFDGPKSMSFMQE